MDARTSVSNAPQPSPWNTLAAMLSLKLSSVLIPQIDPMNSAATEARYTGLLPHTLAAVTQASPEKAETTKGTAVSAVAEA